MRQMHTEWMEWQELVAALKASGAVTEEDCTTLASARPLTPGQRVFAAVRAWGEAYAKLQSEQRRSHANQGA